MNKNMNNMSVATVEIPAKAFDRMMEVISGLAKMHMDLIQLYEMESELKKHHKAYLHVRDHADQVCKHDKAAIQEMLTSLHPANFFPAEEEAEEGDDVEDVFDPVKCRDCACYEDCCEYVQQKAYEENAGIVMMSTETLGLMQDDMLALSEQIDQLTGIFRNMVAGGAISPETLEKVLSGASQLSDEVVERWDNADMVAML